MLRSPSTYTPTARAISPLAVPSCPPSPSPSPTASETGASPKPAPARPPSSQSRETDPSQVDDGSRYG
jgi:hypothetical protein